MAIDPVSPDLVARQREINIQIGIDMNALKQRLERIESECCNGHSTTAPTPPTDPGNYHPTGGADSFYTIDTLTHSAAQNVPAKLKRDIKMIPTGKFGLMDMALTADGDLLHDPGLETAVLMSLFSDKRHEGQRGFWADELIDRETGSHLWLLVREKTTGPEHKEGSVLLRAEDYCHAALQWLLDDKEAVSLTIKASWGPDQITPRMILGIDVYLPVGSRFIGY